MAAAQISPPMTSPSNSRADFKQTVEAMQAGIDRVLDFHVAAFDERQAGLLHGVAIAARAVARVRGVARVAADDRDLSASDLDQPLRREIARLEIGMADGEIDRLLGQVADLDQRDRQRLQEFSRLRRVADRGEHDHLHALRKERADRIGLAAARVVDGLQDVVGAMAFEHAPRRFHEGQVDRVLQASAG